MTQREVMNRDMNFTNTLLGILTGAGFTGLALAIVQYFGTINSPDSSLLGSERDWWVLAVATGLILGAILGGVSGAIIAGLGMSSLKAALFGGAVNLIVFVAISLNDVSSGIKFSLYFLVPTGVVNGIIVALISAQKPLQ